MKSPQLVFLGVVPIALIGRLAIGTCFFAKNLGYGFWRCENVIRSFQFANDSPQIPPGFHSQLHEADFFDGSPINLVLSPKGVSTDISKGFRIWTL